MAEGAGGVIVVTGSVRFAPDAVARVREAALAVMTASRAEDGCLEYAYAEDLLEPGLIRVVERWRDMAALEAHFRAPHMATWQAARAAEQMLERRVTAYTVTEEHPL